VLEAVAFVASLMVELTVVGGVVASPVLEIVAFSERGRLALGVIVASVPVAVEFASPVVVGYGAPEVSNGVEVGWNDSVRLAGAVVSGMNVVLPVGVVSGVPVELPVGVTPGVIVELPVGRGIRPDVGASVGNTEVTLVRPVVSKGRPVYGELVELEGPPVGLEPPRSEVRPPRRPPEALGDPSVGLAPTPVGVYPVPVNCEPWLSVGVAVAPDPAGRGRSPKSNDVELEGSGLVRTVDKPTMIGPVVGDGLCSASGVEEVVGSGRISGRRPPVEVDAPLLLESLEPPDGSGRSPSNRDCEDDELGADESGVVVDCAVGRGRRPSNRDWEDDDSDDDSGVVVDCAVGRGSSPSSRD